MKSYKHLAILALITVLVLSILFGGRTAFSQSAQIANGINYLKSTQNADGSWGGTPSSLNDPFRTTTAALQALRALEASTSSNQANAIQFLSSQTVDVSPFLAARTIALAGTTSSTSADVSALLAQQNLDGGWGTADGLESDPQDTSLALLALKAANVTDQNILTNALTYLIHMQNSDGGWSLTQGEASQVFYTAYALQALNSFRPQLPYLVSNSQTNALSYLHTKQNSDGGYGSPASTTFETAVALLAINGSGVPPTPAEAVATNFLNSSQKANGSWADDAYSTALVLRALAPQPPPATPDRPPVISSQPITTAREGQLYSYQVQATDPDNDPLSYTLLRSPTGMTVSATGLIQWTPTAAQAGSAVIILKVSDGKGGSALQEYTITVLALGVDLTVAGVETSAMTTDTQTLVIGGTVRVQIGNKGGSLFSGSFDVLLFEDRNKNGTYEAGVDNVLGVERLSGSIASNGTAALDVRVSGVVRFRDNVVYAFVDSSNEIVELDETNNIGSSGQSSKYRPPVGDFQPKVKWQWDDPAGGNMSVAPIVAPLIDTNGDGLINERDIPAVIVITAVPNVVTHLTALRGDTGAVIFSVAAPISNTVNPAVGDIDGDGKPEIIAANSSSLICFNNDGTIKWTAPGSKFANNIALADLDGDGKSEIIYGNAVFNSDGTLRWTDQGGLSYLGGTYGGRQVADLNLDGKPKIIAGASALDQNGNVQWYWQDTFGHFGSQLITDPRTKGLSEVWTAVANLDDDPYPEIIAVNSASDNGFNDPVKTAMWIFDHTGHVKAGPFVLAQGVPNKNSAVLGPPTVADFNGDGSRKIAVAIDKTDYSSYENAADPSKVLIGVYGTDGSLKWQRTLITDFDGDHAKAISAFDFDGDGASELVYLDTQKLHILNGRDGTTLFEMGVNRISYLGANNSGHYPVIADVDNDGVADIVVPTYNIYPAGAPPRHGVLVLSDTKGNWRNARRVWNQWQYNVTNVNEDGSIPRHARNSWQANNSHRAQSHIDDIDATAAPDLTVSRVTLDSQSCPTTLGITARIGNGGSLHVASGIKVNFYNGDPAVGGILIGNRQTTKALYPGEFEDVTLPWNGPQPGQVFVTVNDPPAASLKQSSNLSLLPNTWAQSSGFSACCVPLVNYGAYSGIDGKTGSAWVERLGGAVSNGPSFYEVRFPFPVNATSVTIQNSGQSTTGFLSGTLTFSNGFTQPLTLDANGEGSASFAEQQNVSWVRLTASSVKSSGASLSEFIVAGSYVEPQFRIHEGEGRLANNKAASAPFTSPCDTTANHPPQITSAPPITAKVAVNYSYQVQAVDPDHDPLSYALLTAPTSMTVSATGLINWTPADTQTGDSPVTLQVSDGRGGVARQSFAIRVAAPPPPNRPPQITSSAPQSVVFGQTYKYDVTALDPDGDIIVFTLLQAPAGATIDQFGGHLTWTPTASQLGTQFFTLEAQDGHGGSDSQSFTVEVKAVAETPPPDTLPPNTLTCSLSSDKRGYASNSLAQFTLVLQNQSASLDVAGLQAQLTVSDQSGHAIFTSALPFNVLAPHALAKSTAGFSTGTTAPGAYRATVEVRYGQQVVCQPQASFAILSSAAKGDALTGSLTAAPALIEGGQTTTLTYQVQNVGNVDLTALDLKLLLVDTASGTLTQTLTDQTALKGGQSFTNTKTLTSTGIKGGDYLVILQGESGGVSQTVASAPLRINSSTVHLSATNYTVTEGCGAATITVTRTGDTTQPATVDYATSDGTATQRSDYTLTAGTLSFGAGEVSKSFTVLVNEDAYQKGDETVTITLSNAGAGAGLGTESTATLTITDSDAVAAGTNPIDDTGEFVCQHYHDFLSREADAGGAAYWSGEINKCGADVACLLGRRVGVSAAYFTSLEFQQSGYYVYRLYKAGLGRQPTYAEFMPDRSRVVGGADLEASKVAFADQFIARTTFTQQYPNSMTAEQYVDSLNSNTGGAVAQADRDVLVAGLKSGAETRATVLRKVADNQRFQEAEYNSAFVLMQYFGYLRRDPDADGYKFWLGVMNGLDPSAFRGMTCSFITSREYQERFSPVATHSNVDCGNAH